jgi:hypothetical protein
MLRQKIVLPVARRHKPGDSQKSQYPAAMQMSPTAMRGTVVVQSMCRLTEQFARRTLSLFFSIARDEPEIDGGGCFPPPSGDFSRRLRIVLLFSVLRKIDTKDRIYPGTNNRYVR